MPRTRRSAVTYRHAAIAALSFALLAGATGVARANPATNQESSSRLRGTLEGTWRVQITLLNCLTAQPVQPPFPALATFARGGTVTTADGGLSPTVRGTGLGAWGRLRGGGFMAVTEAFLFNGGVRTGVQRVTQQIELASRGEEFTADVTSEIQDTNGNVVATGCATSIGRRLD